jgi:hypothetical protein
MTEPAAPVLRIDHHDVHVHDVDAGHHHQHHRGADHLDDEHVVDRLVDPMDPDATTTVTTLASVAR